MNDDAGRRDLICAALDKMGYEVLCAGGPEEDHSLAHQVTRIIHLLLTDVVMPQMNGKALYESILPVGLEMEMLSMPVCAENVIANRGVLDDVTNYKTSKSFFYRSLFPCGSWPLL